MKFRSIARILFFLLPLASGSGCATKALWNELDNDNKPTNNARVQLFGVNRRLMKHFPPMDVFPLGWIFNRTE
jgi:hypothetical protein